MTHVRFSSFNSKFYIKADTDFMTYVKNIIPIHVTPYRRNNHLNPSKLVEELYLYVEIDYLAILSDIYSIWKPGRAFGHVSNYDDDEFFA